MDRLTERFSNGQAAVYGCGSNCKYDFKYCNNHLEDCPTINEIYERLAQYEEIGLTLEQLLQVDEMYADRCREIAGLERQGKLLKLPCAAGDTVYEIIKTRETISEFAVMGFSVSEHGIFVKWKLINGIYRNLSGFNDDEIGKTVFLTREEAEAALKELEDRNA